MVMGSENATREQGGRYGVVVRRKIAGIKKIPANKEEKAPKTEHRAILITLYSLFNYSFNQSHSLQYHLHTYSNPRHPCMHSHSRLEHKSCAPKS